MKISHLIESDDHSVIDMSTKFGLNEYKTEVKISHNGENKYKVGDYVYIEQSQSDPFVIRRIDELQKTAQGNVAAKVVSFYERAS